jgi:hypothetical protein
MRSARANCRPRNKLIFTLLVSGASVCALAARTRAQDVNPAPIRVKSNEVLVPVLVLNKKGLDQLHGQDIVSYITQTDRDRDQFLQDLAVRDLTAADFRVFEDGKEQAVARVTSQDVSPAGDIGSGGGKWGESKSPSTPEKGIHVTLPIWPGYMVAYAQPPSPEGSCHEVTIKVLRPDVGVYARNQYCSTHDSPTDALNGTKLGRQMESKLEGQKTGSMSVSVTAVPFFTTGQQARLQIAIFFPEGDLKLYDGDCDRPPPISVLGLLNTSDGKLVSRFSDLMPRGLNFRGQHLPDLLPGDAISCVMPSPNQYNIQFYVPPGRYVLQVLIKDRKAFGRADIPVGVDDHDPRSLALSGVVLAHTFRRLPGGVEDTASLPGDYPALASKGVQLMPTANSQFNRDELLYFYFEMFEPQSPHPPSPSVQAHLRIVDTKTGEIEREMQPVDATPYTFPGSPVIPLEAGIDISNLRSGTYRLDVQATDSAGQSTPWHAANFTIEH